jgi:hypothetical protein
MDSFFLLYPFLYLVIGLALTFTFYSLARWNRPFDMISAMTVFVLTLTWLPLILTIVVVFPCWLFIRKPWRL